MRCVFSDRSKADLIAIGDFIARDNPRRAISFVKELEEKCRKLVYAPQREFVKRIESMDIRKTVHGSYLIYFAWLEEAETVLIVHITNAARNKPHI
jgi:plasmid stabilization system protein ParE